MKLFLPIVTLFILQPAISLACSPPQSLLAGEQTVIRQVLQSGIVWDKMHELAGTNAAFQSLEKSKNGLKITLSNKCSLEVSPLWIESPVHGMCPMFSGFEILSSSCE